MKHIAFETLIISVRGADVDFSRGIVKLGVKDDSTIAEREETIREGMKNWEQSMENLLTIHEGDQDYITWMTHEIRDREVAYFERNPFDVIYAISDTGELVLYGMQVYDE